MRGLFLASLFLPTLLFAQNDDIRAQIRAELLADPRTAEMSPTELDALVNALAEETAVSEEGAVYLDAQSAPSYFYDPAPVGEVSPWLAILSAPISLAIFVFLLALAGVLVFMIRHRRNSAADLQNSSE